jgi:hypothetical protein
VNGTAIPDTRRQPGETAFYGSADSKKNLWILLFSAAIVVLAAVLLAYGRDYYFLDLVDRPFSPKHADLKPSGTIGLRLGISGFIMLAMVYLYPLRKHWARLGRIGRTKNWFDFHVFLGLSAPVLISFHSAFKLHGFAGMAYWTMLALVGSGIVGRYFYAQIPRNISAAEMSLKEMQDLKLSLLNDLKIQKSISFQAVEALFRLPESQEVQAMSTLKALACMIGMDILRPFRVWSLRRSGIRADGRFPWFGGVIRTGNRELEEAILLASKQSALSGRILFLSKTQRVFHGWHIIHRPFSISFAVFVIIHVTVVTWLGYY